MIIRGPRTPRLMSAEHQRDCYQRVQAAMEAFDAEGGEIPHLEEVANRAGIADLDTVRWLVIQVAADKGRQLEHRMECVNCAREFDPVAHLWLCPHCGTRNSEGESL